MNQQDPLFYLGEANDWRKEWTNMPDFVEPTRNTEVRNKIDVSDVVKYCALKTSQFPKYPIYVISKGRWAYNLTSKALDKLNIDHLVVVEPSEYDHYAAEIDADKLLVLPENFSERGSGSIPTRNWVWRHALDNHHKRHWILDDNISGFGIQKGGRRVRSQSNGDLFSICEGFVDRYANVALAGIRYRFHHNYTKAPFLANTRIYSCILIDNSTEAKWRGKYNEDTDLSLQILKAGLCTILFTWCYCDKAATMQMRGGNTDTIYKNGRKEFATSLRDKHPDVARVVKRFGRWHHHVDYRRFAYNKLEKIGLTN